MTEYAIVHKNRVILGPVSWSQKYFKTVLKVRHRIDANNIPVNAPSELPLEIDADTKIHAVTEVRPEFNPMVEYLQGPIWDFTNDVIVANYNVLDIPIENARQNFRDLAALERYKKEEAGTTTTLQDTEIFLDTSREGRNIFLQKYLLMGDEDVINWKFPQAWLSITKEELGFVIFVGSSWIQAAFDWEKDINDQINAAETKEQLLAIEIVEESDEEELND